MDGDLSSGQCYQPFEQKPEQYISNSEYCKLIVSIVCYFQVCMEWVILIGQDGVQRPPIRFPTTGSLLSFLNCLENGLHPHGELDPPFV